MLRTIRMKFAIASIATLVISCSGITESAAQYKFTLVGSTACGPEIKTALAIPSDLKCDFIRWSIEFNTMYGDQFTLNANYGEAQPNTKGFVNGGLKMNVTGKFESSTLFDDNNPGVRVPPKELYHLKKGKIDFWLLKLNANLFQLLKPDGSMMIGNGGWSYTLNRKPAIANAALPAGMSSGLSKSPRLTFDGRTPCAELANIIERPADLGECFKIKWRIILDRDPTTLRPSSFTMDTTFNRRETISGTWSESVIGNAVIYRLIPAERAKSFSLLAGDDSLLFFLDDNNRPLVGNEDFSFTLNRLDR